MLPMSAVKSHESRMTSAHVVERIGLVDSTTRRLVSRLVGNAEISVQKKIRSQRFSLSNMLFENQCTPTVECAMEDGLKEHQSNGTIEVKVRENTKTSQSDEECVGRAHEMRSTFETSHLGVPRGARGKTDVKVSSWSCRAHSLRTECWQAVPQTAG